MSPTSEAAPCTHQPPTSHPRKVQQAKQSKAKKGKRVTAKADREKGRRKRELTAKTEKIKNKTRRKCGRSATVIYGNGGWPNYMGKRGEKERKKVEMERVPEQAKKACECPSCRAANWGRRAKTELKVTTCRLFNTFSHTPM